MEVIIGFTVLGIVGLGLGLLAKAIYYVDKRLDGK